MPLSSCAIKYALQRPPTEQHPPEADRTVMSAPHNLFANFSLRPAMSNYLYATYANGQLSRPQGCQSSLAPPYAVHLPETLPTGLNRPVFVLRIFLPENRSVSKKFEQHRCNRRFFLAYSKTWLHFQLLASFHFRVRLTCELKFNE